MRYIETIRLEDGYLHLHDLHRRRMAATVCEVYGDRAEAPDIDAAINSIDRIPDDGIYKCRIVYDTLIRDVEFQPYTRRTVKSLKAVEADSDLDYHLKSCDRSALTTLASRRGACDEVIIIRDGLITDTSYTNLVFHGRDGLYTPRQPLLQGVMRQHLLNRGIVTAIDLTPDDIAPGNPRGITRVSLINAMLPLGSTPAIATDQIYF